MITQTDRYLQMINQLQKRTGIANPVQGSAAGGLIQSVNIAQTLLEQDALNIYNSENISAASDYQLDKLLKSLYGISRRQSISHSVTSNMETVIFYVNSGTFGNINSEIDILIPAGTKIDGVGTGGYVSFTVAKDTTLPSGASSQAVSVTLLSGYSDAIPSNTLTNHYFTNYAGYSQDLLKVTNQNVIASGRPVETDENFRYRGINTLRSFSLDTDASIHSIITSIPGISDCTTEISPLGGGTTNVYVKSVSPVPSNELLAQCYLAIKDVYQSKFQILPFNTIGLGFEINIIVNNPNIYIGNASFINLIINTITRYINNYSNTTLDIYSIYNQIYSLNTDIISIEITAAYMYTGKDEYRYKTTIDLTDITQTSISLNTNEKFITEITPNAIVLSINP